MENFPWGSNQQYTNTKMWFAFGIDDDRRALIIKVIGNSQPDWKIVTELFLGEILEFAKLK